SRLVALAGLLTWAGSVLLLSGVRRLNRPSLSDRLRPYHPGAPARDRAIDPNAPFRQLIGPVITATGNRLAALMGVAEDARTRLHRIHSPLTAQGFRARQAAWSGA